MMIKGTIEYNCIDSKGSWGKWYDAFRLVVSSDEKGYDINQTKEQYEWVNRNRKHKTDVFVMQVEPITRTLVSIEKYVEPPQEVYVAELEPLTEEKPYRCDYCDCATDGKIAGLCIPCWRRCGFQTAFQEEWDRGAAERQSAESERREGRI